MHKRSAEISIFFSFLCVSVCAFIYVVMYSAQTHITKFKIEALADTSIRSCFSEYCISLFDDYDLLYVDTSYRVSDGGMDSFTDHLAGYIEENIVTDCNTFYKISFVDAKVLNSVFAYDNGYRSFKRQIRKYVKDKGFSVTGEEALDIYIYDKLSSRYDAKNYSVNEYEIEYIATGQFEELKPEHDEQDDSENDDEMQAEEDGSYEEFFANEYEYNDALDELLSKVSYDTKLDRLIDVIEINEKENYSESFDFANLLESADIKFYLSGSGKTYEISKSYSLN